MDERRIQAYVALIEQLLSCPQGKEAEVLQQQAELVDEGLLVVMQQYADWLEQQENSNAGWLRQVAQRLAAVLENANVQAGEAPQEAEQFFADGLAACVRQPRRCPASLSVSSAASG